MFQTIRYVRPVPNFIFPCYERMPTQRRLHKLCPVSQVGQARLHQKGPLDSVGVAQGAGCFLFRNLFSTIAVEGAFAQSDLI